MSLRYIVIDTNIFISAPLSPRGTAYQALTKAVQEFTIVYSEETYQEIASRLYKTKFDRYISNERRAEFLNLIQSKSRFIKTIPQITICLDSDGNKFLELVLDGGSFPLLFHRSIRLRSLSEVEVNTHPIYAAQY